MAGKRRRIQAKEEGIKGRGRKEPGNGQLFGDILEEEKLEGRDEIPEVPRMARLCEYNKTNEKNRTEETLLERIVHARRVPVMMNGNARSPDPAAVRINDPRSGRAHFLIHYQRNAPDADPSKTVEFQQVLAEGNMPRRLKQLELHD